MIKYRKKGELKLYVLHGRSLDAAKVWLRRVPTEQETHRKKPPRDIGTRREVATAEIRADWERFE